MAAVMTTPRVHLGYRAEPTIRPRPRASAATYWRRRAAAAGLALVIVLVAAQAGGALGDSPLAVSGRRPASPGATAQASARVHYVVERGD